MTNTGPPRNKLNMAIILKNEDALGIAVLFVTLTP